MRDKQNKEYPYKQLGLWLKGLRQKKQETLAEVSGAVEIEAETLQEIEKGINRPGEDILMLLISYFNVREDDAVKAWELAGYDKLTPGGSSSDHGSSQSVFVMPFDVRVAYTDMAHVSKNKYGVTINFSQADGIGGQPLVVSRVGMSYEHAKKLLEVLQKSLQEPEQKLLPAPEQNADRKKQ